MESVREMHRDKMPFPTETFAPGGARAAASAGDSSNRARMLTICNEMMNQVCGCP